VLHVISMSVDIEMSNAIKEVYLNLNIFMCSYSTFSQFFALLSVNKQGSSCASECPSCMETSCSMSRAAMLPTSMSGMCRCWPGGSVGLGALGGREACILCRGVWQLSAREKSIYSGASTPTRAINQLTQFDTFRPHRQVPGPYDISLYTGDHCQPADKTPNGSIN